MLAKETVKRNTNLRKIVSLHSLLNFFLQAEKRLKETCKDYHLVS
ncbi:hypothetical protein CP03DC35_0413 [Chlamydia psittaci 03DC35]|uniref:Uncharacterized protein n=1 Tax=Chlamydia psittaci 99DC5 TaxID=1112251 RepID=A0ABN0MPT8_CHLPS|nr:hypothetical protein B598_0013 [Chlamydia psittaci GR9]EPJ15831.1 hypothetical protein CP02DC18_0431 [Chlamydia psittaci 02DC18]EPJ17306.1 hypothetical protein CP02DC22_0421 [Chlamydia psittaci 02DC22]EPJ23287.1 hypothetical protein CP08DC60_1031 [Chlamydia psittaci 08DC60]EPJ25526.1 hypothetical protein CP09DC77_0422 [Chlamydia psittaci 09DC77]EPJ26844.1 hypothetical protein CP09DC80_0420 [Chlamydia psittaci 09DC80]EPJ27784.1 hypothetical protein CPC1998_0776 [Chlamydia psittaci C19/98]E